MTKIKFGTDGWRGIIAEDYTFENVEKVALAFAQYYKKHPKIERGVVVGGDARFGSQDFAERAAQVIASQGIKVALADGVVSTPMLSLGIIKKRAAAGVMITASHNPPQWNGFKIKAEFGGSALMKDIKKIEARVAKILESGKAPKIKPMDQLRKEGLIRDADLRKPYVNDITKKIDFSAIKKSGLKIAYDVMYGAAFGVMDMLYPDATMIHNEHNPGFKGIAPEPLAKNLQEFIQLIIKEKFDYGLVTDGDADRLGAVDDHGNYISTQLIIPILLKYLVEEKKQKGSVVKTVSVSDIVTKMCEKYGLKLYEKPVGFKYVTEIMVKEKVLIGGEESGGVGMAVHIPERDGIYNGLLLAEYLAKSGKTLSEAVQEIYDEYGKVYYDRIDMRTTEKNKNAIMAKCEKGLKTLGSHEVLSTETKDGYKFRVDGGWLLIRASGTEPILRLYAEADSRAKMQALLKAAQEL
ncbi:MAG: phosphomannomutase [Ectothiorhodospiraceae bacterium]|nr:phosphomannomutase [Ectothiorhodospiraceae bacterium]